MGALRCCRKGRSGHGRTGGSTPRHRRIPRRFFVLVKLISVQELAEAERRAIVLHESVVLGRGLGSVSKAFALQIILAVNAENLNSSFIQSGSPCEAKVLYGFFNEFGHSPRLAYEARELSSRQNNTLSMEAALHGLDLNLLERIENAGVTMANLPLPKYPICSFSYLLRKRIHTALVWLSHRSTS